MSASPGPLVYFAGPLFTHAEQRWNASLAAELDALGYRVLLPQRLVADLIEPGRPLPTEAMFQLLVERIREAAAVVAVLDGADPDSGTCFECGAAFAWGTPVVGLRTDLRRGGDHPERDVNLMLAHGCATLLNLPPDAEPDVAAVARRLAAALRAVL
tara:strand:- start:274 stop:744 length:471 start_codon:yes stop_codon:yes gene_type:complete